MRILPLNSEATQALATVFRSRQFLIRQRTRTMNAIRGMLAEFGFTTGLGVHQVSRLRARLADVASPLPERVSTSMDALFTHLVQLNEHIGRLTDEIKNHVKEDANAKKLKTVPGVGPITVFAIQAFVGDLKRFRNGRENTAREVNTDWVPSPKWDSGIYGLCWLTVACQSSGQSLTVQHPRVRLGSLECSSKNPGRWLSSHSPIEWLEFCGIQPSMRPNMTPPSAPSEHPNHDHNDIKMAWP